MQKTIAVIGAGNMGKCLISGLIKNGHDARHIIATHPETAACEEIQKEFGIKVTTDNRDAARKAELIILSVKPQVMAHVLTEIRSVLTHNPCLISVAAGVRIHNIETFIQEKLPIIRAMPNVPALMQHGATALFANSKADETDKKIAESIFNAVGISIWLSEEKLMDVVTALSGSGPAYFFLIMEALQSAAEKHGLSKEIAHLLICQTAFGAGYMATHSEKNFSALRETVTSKGGTTEKAIFVLEDNHIRDIFEKAITAAKERSETLAQHLEEKS